MKIYRVLFLVAFLALLAVFPVAAQGETPPGVPGLELTVEQLVVVGFITSALVMVIRLVIEVLAKRKLVLPDWVMQLIVYIVSGGVALLWFPPSLPPLPVVPPGSELPDAIALYNSFAATFLSTLTGFLVIAHLFYKWIVGKVREKLGNKFLPKVYGARRK